MKKFTSAVLAVAMLIALNVPALATTVEQKGPVNGDRVTAADVIDFSVFDEMPGVTYTVCDNGAVFFSTVSGSATERLIEQELERQLSVLPPPDEETEILRSPDDKEVTRTFSQYYIASNGQTLRYKITVTGVYNPLNNIAEVIDVSYTRNSFISPGSGIKDSVDSSGNQAYFYITDNGKAASATYTLHSNGGFTVTLEGGMKNG